MAGSFEDTMTFPDADALRAHAEGHYGRANSWRPGARQAPPFKRRWSTETKLIAAAAVIATCVVTASFMAFYAMRDYADSTAWVERSVDTIASLHLVQTNMAEGRMEVIAYLSDLDPRHIKARLQRKEVVKHEIASLRAVLGDAQQLEFLGLFDEAFATRGKLYDQMIAASNESGSAAGLQLLRRPEFLADSMAMAQIVDGMLAREHVLFAERQLVEQGKRRTVLLISATTLVLFLVATLLLFFHIHRDLRIRAQLGRDRDSTRRFLESIVMAMPHPILIKEAPSLSYALVNPAMARMLGLPLEDTLEKSDYNFFTKERAGRAEIADRRALAEGKLSMMVAKVPTATQGERTFQITRMPFEDEAGKQYLLNIAEDITDDVATQERLHDVNTVLKRQTEELRAAVGELSSFSYTVSHDLRTPLRAIDGFAEMLSEDCGPQLDDAGRRYISIIRDSSQRMGQLIDALLYYTRIGREAPTLSAVDMDQLAAEGVTAARAAFPSVQAEWDVAALPPAGADRALLRQVWINLLSNALKFAQEADQPRIAVRGVIEGREVVYSVRDNGIGFDSRYASKLFGLFQRLHTDDPYVGSGVGLAVVQRIVAHHGGRVWAEGAPGAGATFYFSLPRERSGVGA